MAHTTTREQKTRMLCTAGLMAALACVSNFISIATPASRIHIGNAVCVLCGLILGPAYGFFAAGVGNAIFDIIGGYGMEFVITFINKGAIQCGFCTPGFVMNAIALFRENPYPDEAEIKEFLSGNLCRCSGYEGQLRGILDYLKVKKAKEASVENKENIAEEVK